MPRLYTVRHGESEMNLRADVIGGRSNHVELTEKGIRQAKAFGQWLADSPIRPDIVYFSPAVRTIQTMNFALEAAEIDVECIVDDRLQELSQGVKEGADRKATYTDEVVAQIKKELLDFKFDEGESIAMVMERMMDFAHDITAKHPQKTIMVFGHGFAIRALAGAIQKLSHQDIVHKLETPNLSLSTFDLAPNHYSVRSFCRRVIDEDSV